MMTLFLNTLCTAIIKVIYPARNFKRWISNDKTIACVPWNAFMIYVDSFIKSAMFHANDQVFVYGSLAN